MTDKTIKAIQGAAHDTYNPKYQMIIQSALAIAEAAVKAQTLDENGLKPCPLCACKAKLSKHRSKSGKIKYAVFCCDVQTKYYTQGRSAITAWNTRPLDTLVQKLIEESE